MKKFPEIVVEIIIKVVDNIEIKIIKKLRKNFKETKTNFPQFQLLAFCTNSLIKLIFFNLFYYFQ